MVCSWLATRMLTPARIHSFTIVTALALVPIAASAQRTNNSAPDRRSLLAQAQRARGQNNHNLALYFAEQAGRLQMTSSVRRFIAEEQLALGQLAEAITSAEHCVREANAEPPSENHGIVLTGCQEMIRSLRARVASASFTATAPIADAVELELNGQPVARESAQTSAGAQRWVAVGRQVLRARMAGFAPVELTRELSAGESWTVRITAPQPPARRACASAASSAAGVDTLVLPGTAAPSDARARLWFDALPANAAVSLDSHELEIDACPAPSTHRSANLAAGTHDVTITLAGHRPLHRSITVREGEDLAFGTVELEALPPPTREQAPPATRTIVTRGWSPVGPIVGGVGVASLATGAALWFVSDATYATLRERCSSSGCPGDTQAANDAASIRALDAASTGLVIGGALATAAGIALTFAIRPERATTVPVTVSMTHDRLLFTGRF